eukprot:1704548-Pleurochrysis_carterae.AAC.2
MGREGARPNLGWRSRDVLQPAFGGLMKNKFFPLAHCCPAQHVTRSTCARCDVRSRRVAPRSRSSSSRR